MEDPPAANDISEELQQAFWGLPLASIGPLRAHLVDRCVVCGAERRAEFYAVPEVREVARYFANLVRALAFSSLPLPDVAAVASAWWGRQAGVRYTHAERVERVLAHILHCSTPEWLLRFSLTRCSVQAVAAVGAAGRHLGVASPRPPPAAAQKLAVHLAEIANTAKSSILAYLATAPPPAADACVFSDVPDVRTASTCLICHGGAAPGSTPHQRFAALYAQKFSAGTYARAAEAANAVAMGVCEDDRVKLGVDRAALAMCALDHYVRHNVSPDGLVYKLRAAYHGVALAMLGCGVRMEGGTLVPDTRGMKDMRRAENAITELQRAILARPGSARLCGIPPQGLAFVVA